MNSKSSVVAILFAILVLSLLSISPESAGHNEDQPPEHTHTYPNVYGVCFCPDPAIFWQYDDDCETMTIEGFFVFVASTECTHGVWQPPPPKAFLWMSRYRMRTRLLWMLPW